MLLFFDKETTGLPDFGAPSEAEHQPHIAQVAAALVDPGSRKIVSSIDLIIRPDGWEIPEEVAKIHGIDTATAMRVGVPEKLAVEMLLAMHAKAERRIAHNQSFDARIMRIALKRYGYPEDIVEGFRTAKAECTCDMATPICQLPATDRMRGAGFGSKWKKPKLTEAYEHFFGKPMENAHSAMADVLACIQIYWHMKDQETARAMAHA
jgi:DNA polymerase-3 subunit epsilon